ncbi:Non-heme 11 kDa protein of cytochrome bc1 complex [Marasmius fiardii PR-910]|nr:Non-heme 11 kDa protein of cytochrome bc1 complex [Marasmius fiardii PR-910]
MSSLSSFLSSVFSVVHNDAEEKPETETKNEAQEEPAAEQEEEEEEEPEDPHPAIREECQNSGKCAQLAKHFEHCNEKVNSGQGFKGEDCVEELMMHCADTCAAPKLFAQLK